MGATAFYEPRPEEAGMRRDHEGVRFGPSRDREGAVMGRDPEGVRFGPSRDREGAVMGRDRLLRAVTVRERL